MQHFCVTSTFNLANETYNIAKQIISMGFQKKRFQILYRSIRCEGHQMPTIAAKFRGAKIYEKSKQTVASNLTAGKNSVVKQKPVDVSFIGFLKLNIHINCYLTIWTKNLRLTTHKIMLNIGKSIMQTTTIKNTLNLYCRQIVVVLFLFVFKSLR